MPLRRIKLFQHGGGVKRGITKRRPLRIAPLTTRVVDEHSYDVVADLTNEEISFEADDADDEEHSYDRVADLINEEISFDADDADDEEHSYDGEADLSSEEYYIDLDKAEMSSTISVAILHEQIEMDKTAAIFDDETTDNIVEAQEDCFLPPFQQSINLKLIEPLKHSFLCKGWTAYHKSFLGGKRSDLETDAILTSVLKIIFRIHFTALFLEIPYKQKMTAYDFMLRLIVEYPLQKALTQVIDGYPYSHETLKHHLLHMTYTLRWIKSQNVSQSKKFDRGIISLTSLLEVTVRGIKKQIRREVSHKDTSIKNAVEEGKYPAGGRQELVNILMEDANTTAEKYGEGSLVIVTEQIYNNFLELFLASLWVLTAQGRVGPIELLEMSSLQDFRRLGYTTSQEFKTSSSTSQKHCAIICPKTSLMLLEIYIYKFRPVVVPRQQLILPTDPLLLNYQGRRLNTISRLVTSYWRKHSSLHLTTNTFRSLIETEIAGREDLSTSERNAVHTLVGHSSATAEDFYVRTELSKNVRLATKALLGDNNDELSLITAQPPAVQYIRIDWGREHPDYLKQGKVRWTDEEKSSIAGIVEEFRSSGTGGKYETALMAEVLKVIKKRPELQPIFHSTHIYSSARLRAGFPELSVRKKKEEY